jgi:alkanesulfonate monooxygenase
MAAMSDLSIMVFPWDAKRPAIEDITAVAKLAEELGFYSVTLPTHMTLPPGWLFEGFENSDVLDGLAVVPVLAAHTKTIRIGFNSVLLPLLPPYAWAKYLATLDVISGGRLIVGAAMGWWEEDFGSVGVNRRRRGRLFDEQLELVTRLWTEDRVSFEGEHYRIDDLPLEPKPVQKPYPPIWVGGGPASVGRAARYGEYLLAFWPDEEAARDFWTPKLDAANAEADGRAKLAAFTFAYVAEDAADLAAIGPRLRTAVAFEDATVDPARVTVSGSPERCAERIRALNEAGVAHFVLEFQFHGGESCAFGMRQMERFAREVGPLL